MNIDIRNLDINPDLLKRVIKYLIVAFIPFLIIKIFYIVFLIFLQKSTISVDRTATTNFYEKFKLSKSFDVKNYQVPKDATNNQVEGVVYKLDDIKLVGAYISEEKKFITIDDKGKIEFVDINTEYKGYLLVLIQRNRAVFVKDGKNYELKVEDLPLPEYKEVKVSTQVEDIVVKDENLRSLKRDVIDNYAKNFDSIWKDINILEVREGDEIVGFKIRYISPSSLFAKIGLLPGDTIKYVNNKELKSYADAFYFYKKINELNSIRITVLRDNELKDLEYEIN